MNQENYDIFNGAPVIYRYTRKQAIDDGVLVDLTEWSKETGFTIPVACTAAVWNQYVVPPEGTRELGQSERGRATISCSCCSTRSNVTRGAAIG